MFLRWFHSFLKTKIVEGRFSPPKTKRAILSYACFLIYPASRSSIPLFCEHKRYAYQSKYADMTFH